MRSENKNPSFVVKLVLTLIIAIISYLILMAALGPVLISSLGELYTRRTIFIITLIISILFAISLSKDNRTDISAEMNVNNSTDIRPKRKYRLLIFGLLAFLMLPFGFAGVLPSRGHGDLPPLWGGGLCLVSGIILIYLYLTDRK